MDLSSIPSFQSVGGPNGPQSGTPPQGPPPPPRSEDGNIQSPEDIFDTLSALNEEERTEYYETLDANSPPELQGLDHEAIYQNLSALSEDERTDFFESFKAQKDSGVGLNIEQSLTNYLQQSGFTSNYDPYVSSLFNSFA